MAADEIAALDWAAKPPKELWRISIGPGWGSFAYDKGRLSTQEQRGDKEHITCYSAVDGRMIWTHADDARFSEVVSGAGPRSTPSVVGGYLYALGCKGLLTCLSDLDGAVVWQRDLAKELSAPVPMRVFSGSPLIVGDTLIIYAGASGENGLIAMEARTGKPVWGFASTDMNYTTARPMTLCDQECIIFCDSRGVHALAPETGVEMWTFQPKMWKGPAMVDPQQMSPLSLLVGLGDGVGLARLEVRRTAAAWSIEEIARIPVLNDKTWNHPIVVGDRLFLRNGKAAVCMQLAP